MERKELRRMRKFELLELLLEQEREIQALQMANESLCSQLDIQQLKIEKAGSITEAALSLSGAFEAAQSRNRNIRYIFALAAVAAATIIIVTNIWLPILKIVGSSM